MPHGDPLRHFIEGRNRDVMRNYFLSILVAAGILACSPAQRPAGKSFLESSVDLLRGKIEAGMATAKFTCRQELLCGSSVIPMFYARREYVPAWMGPDGRFSQADSLIATIRDSDREGLPPDGYHLLPGRVDPETLHADWVAYNPTTDLGALLKSSLDANTVEHSLKGLRHPHPSYVGLQNTL